MNQHDTNNLNFLLSIGLQQIQEWSSQMPLDDIVYAIELLQHECSRLKLEIVEMSDDVQDTKLAQQVIASVRNK